MCLDPRQVKNVMRDLKDELNDRPQLKESPVSAALPSPFSGGRTVRRVVLSELARGCALLSDWVMLGLTCPRPRALCSRHGPRHAVASGSLSAFCKDGLAARILAHDGCLLFFGAGVHAPWPCRAYLSTVWSRAKPQRQFLVVGGEPAPNWSSIGRNRSTVGHRVHRECRWSDCGSSVSVSSFGRWAL